MYSEIIINAASNHGKNVKAIAQAVALLSAGFGHNELQVRAAIKAENKAITLRIGKEAFKSVAPAISKCAKVLRECPETDTIASAWIREQNVTISGIIEDATVTAMWTLVANPRADEELTDAEYLQKLQKFVEKHGNRPHLVTIGFLASVKKVPAHFEVEEFAEV